MSCLTGEGLSNIQDYIFHLPVPAHQFVASSVVSTPPNQVYSSPDLVSSQNPHDVKDSGVKTEYCASLNSDESPPLSAPGLISSEDSISDVELYTTEVRVVGAFPNPSIPSGHSIVLSDETSTEPGPPLSSPGPYHGSNIMLRQVDTDGSKMPKDTAAMRIIARSFDLSSSVTHSSTYISSSASSTALVNKNIMISPNFTKSSSLSKLDAFNRFGALKSLKGGENNAISRIESDGVDFTQLVDGLISADRVYLVVIQRGVLSVGDILWVGPCCRGFQSYVYRFMHVSYLHSFRRF